MIRKELAVNKFKEGYNCSQSVLYAYSDLFKISIDDLLRISNGFGAGIGRSQESCGAVTGGVMVLGMLYGRGENQEKIEQEKCYEKVRELMVQFDKKHKSTSCLDLLDNCILTKPEGQERFKNEKMIERCYGYVISVVEILEELTNCRGEK